MNMTYEEMVRILVDKGHNKEFAERQASEDFVLQDLPSTSKPYQCSVCRRWLSQFEDRYHYHPCE